MTRMGRWGDHSQGLISNNTIFRPERCVYVDQQSGSVVDWSITGNVIQVHNDSEQETTPKAIIEFDSGTGSVRDITISGNEIESHTASGGSDALQDACVVFDCVDASSASRVAIVGNTIGNINKSAIRVNRAAGLTISANTIEDSDDGAMGLHLSPGGTVTAASIVGNSFWEVDGTTVKVETELLSGYISSNAGIRTGDFLDIDFSDDLNGLVVSNNVIQDDSDESGSWVFDIGPDDSPVGELQVRGNLARALNGDNGIRVKDGGQISRVVIKNNTVLEGDGSASDLPDGSDDVIVSDNISS